MSLPGKIHPGIRSGNSKRLLSMAAGLPLFMPRISRTRSPWQGSLQQGFSILLIQIRCFTANVNVSRRFSGVNPYACRQKRSLGHHIRMRFRLKSHRSCITSNANFLITYIGEHEYYAKALSSKRYQRIKNVYEGMLIVDHNHHGCNSASRAPDNRSL